MLSLYDLNAIGLALDVIGFAILFVLALPAVMRRNFVASEQVDVDGVRLDSDQIARLENPERAKRLERRRQKRQMAGYVTGGLMVIVGFTLQFFAVILR